SGRRMLCPVAFHGARAHMASDRAFGRLTIRASTICFGVSLAAADVSEVVAANECGAGTNVTCTSASNPYNLGISYSNANQTVSTVGPIAITTGAVTAGNGTGINTRVQSGNGAITVTANGNVSGTMGGISAVAQGTGPVGVTTKSVSTTLDNAGGVFAQSSGG